MPCLLLVATLVLVISLCCLLLVPTWLWLANKVVNHECLCGHSVTGRYLSCSIRLRNNWTTITLSSLGYPTVTKNIKHDKATLLFYIIIMILQLMISIKSVVTCCNALLNHHEPNLIGPWFDLTHHVPSTSYHHYHHGCNFIQCY